jgi:hypothetical protein
MYIPNWYDYMMGGGGGGRRITKKEETVIGVAHETGTSQESVASRPGGNGPGSGGKGSEGGNENDHENTQEEEENTQVSEPEEKDDGDDDDGENMELGTVVSAAQLILSDTVIADEDVDLMSYPKKRITKAMLTKTGQAVGKLAVQEIPAHTILTRVMIA